MNFMENLDKLLYNAYEGCSVAMPALHKVESYTQHILKT